MHACMHACTHARAHTHTHTHTHTHAHTHTQAYAKRVKLPQFVRRVLSNAIVYRVNYLRCLAAFGVAEVVFWRNIHGAAVLVLSVLSAAVVRSNMLALAAEQQRLERKTRAGGAMSNFLAQQQIFGQSGAAKARDAALDKMQTDKAQLSAVCVCVFARARAHVVQFFLSRLFVSVSLSRSPRTHPPTHTHTRAGAGSAGADVGTRVAEQRGAQPVLCDARPRPAPRTPAAKLPTAGQGDKLRR